MIVDYQDELDSRILHLGDDDINVTDPEIGPYPIPPGRGRWRLTLHHRTLTGSQVANQPTPVPSWQQTLITELPNARGRKLEQARNQEAVLTFVMNGKDPACAQILEMQHDVMAWRWDEFTGQDVCMFRGVITNSQDDLTAEAHTVTFTCHDYLAMLARRMIVSKTGVAYTNLDQDTIASRIVESAQYTVPLTGSFTVSALLPLWTMTCNPDGSARGLSGTIRVRNYAGGSNQRDLLDQLANVIGGFEYDVVPNPRTTWQTGRYIGNDAVRIFFPEQGVVRNDFMLVFGGNISAITRAITSSDYSNYARVIGNNGSSDPNAAQQAADAFTNNDPEVGVWASNDNGSSDVSDTSTLQERASGIINNFGVLLPSYTITMRPGRYRYGNPNMGDTVTMRINSGRLNVVTPIRVIAITYNVGDDGQEDVELTVGKAKPKLTKLFNTIHRDTAALSRR